MVMLYRCYFHLLVNQSRNSLSDAYQFLWWGFSFNFLYRFWLGLYFDLNFNLRLCWFNFLLVRWDGIRFPKFLLILLLFFLPMLNFLFENILFHLFLVEVAIATDISLLEIVFDVGNRHEGSRLTLTTEVLLQEDEIVRVRNIIVSIFINVVKNGFQSCFLGVNADKWQAVY